MSANSVPVLPDWTRHSWASVAERQWWNPLLKQASASFMKWERMSVVAGQRQACWQTCKPEELLGLTEWCAKFGLVPIVNATMPAFNGYSSGVTNMKAGVANIYRVVITKPENVKNIFPFDDDKFGKLLGYPDCCRKHFLETWGKGQVDDTWEQFKATENNSRQIGLPSTLMRWMGIRFVPHLPCRFDCEESVKQAEGFIKLAEAGGNKEDVLLIKEVLKWPVKWSRLFGIAEIVTPGLKISTRTDWTPDKQTFETEGSYNKPEAWLWTDNGFIDPTPMREAHKIIINSLIENLPQGARVLDLGCGNGMLLRRLTIYRPDVKIAGVDYNGNAIKHAPSLVGKWWTGKIQDTIPQWQAWKPTAALINPERLDEMADPSATRDALKAIPQVFPYAYPDTLKNRNLEQLCEAVDFNGFQGLQRTPTVSVGMLCNS